MCWIYIIIHFIVLCILLCCRVVVQSLSLWIAINKLTRVFCVYFGRFASHTDSGEFCIIFFLHHRHRHHHVHRHYYHTWCYKTHYIFSFVKAFIDADSTNASFLLCSLKQRRKNLVDFFSEFPVFLSDALWATDDAMPLSFRWFFWVFFSLCFCFFSIEIVFWVKERTISVQGKKGEKEWELIGKKTAGPYIWPYFLAFIHIINFISL